MLLSLATLASALIAGLFGGVMFRRLFFRRVERQMRALLALRLDDFDRQDVVVVAESDKVGAFVVFKDSEPICMLELQTHGVAWSAPGQEWVPWSLIHSTLNERSAHKTASYLVERLYDLAKSR